MLREHRGDGHVAALVAERVGRTEAHVLAALALGIHPAESFGRLHHLPTAHMAAVMDGLRARGLVDPAGRFTEQGRATKERIEELTDRLAEAPYEVLTASELEELVGLLEPISARVRAATER
jgi:ADP-heptose:LPS heptosyltransferase